ISANDTRTPSSPPIRPAADRTPAGRRRGESVDLDVRAGTRGRVLLALLADRQIAEGGRLHLDRADDAVVDPVRTGPRRLTAGGREVHDDRPTHPGGGLRRRGKAPADDDAVAAEVALAADAAGDGR